MNLIGHYKSKTGLYHAALNGKDNTLCGLRTGITNYPHSTRSWVDCDKCKKKIPSDVG